MEYGLEEIGKVFLMIAGGGAFIGGGIGGFFLAKRGAKQLSKIETELTNVSVEPFDPNTRATIRQRLEEVVETLADLNQQVRFIRGDFKEMNRRVGRVEAQITDIRSTQTELGEGQYEMRQEFGKTKDRIEEMENNRRGDKK